RTADPARSRRVRPGLSAQGSEAPARQRRRIATDGQHLQDSGPVGPAGGSKMVGSSSSAPCDAGEGQYHNLGCQRALRPGRRGESVDKWAYDSARRRDAAELVDIADFNLPLLDEPSQRPWRDYGSSRHREFATSDGRTASRYSLRAGWAVAVHIILSYSNWLRCRSRVSTACSTR